MTNKSPKLARAIARALVATTMCVAAVQQFAQTAGAQRLQFEVVSIRHNTSGERNVAMTRPTPDRLVATNMPLRAFIQSVFRIRRHQLIGAPDWTEREYYDIQAKTEGMPTSEQFQQMLETLLADRFAFVGKRETRQFPIYVLMLDNPARGPKMQPSGDVDCPTPPVAPQPSAAQGQPRSTVVPCFPQVSMTRVEGRQVTMTTLANVLSPFLDREVVDRTGLTGGFDVTLEYEYGGQGTGTPIVTAVRENLGLKLEPTAGPVDVVVVERISRPTDN